jgi:hypothetical protein
VAEEVALLDAVEAYGLGNWRDAANYVGGGKTDAACARHCRRRRKRMCNAGDILTSSRSSGFT